MVPPPCDPTGGCSEKSKTPDLWAEGRASGKVQVLYLLWEPAPKGHILSKGLTKNALCGILNTERRVPETRP